MPTKLKTSADVEKVAKHALRPHLSPTELLAEHARHQRDQYAERAADTLRRADKEARVANGVEQGEIADALGQHDTWESRYQGFRQQVAEQRERYSIRHEPLTYRRASEDGKYSWVADQWRARDASQVESVQRIERHRAEMAVELPRLRRQVESESRAREAALGAEFETRVTPQTTQGFGGYFTPPSWVIEDFATAQRAQRVLSRQFTTFTMPAAPGFSSVNLPRITTGASTSAGPQVTPVSDTDIVDASATATLATIAGQQDVSIQLLEQSPRNAHLDTVVFTELQASYDATLESQVWTGSGGTYELNGVLNAGIGAVTTSEAIGVKTFPALGESFGYVSDRRKLSPTGWYMRGGRWASIAVAEDEQKRPLWTLLDNQSTRTTQPIGTLLGLPVFLTESVPVTLGTAKNQDCILAGRPSNSYFWESAPTLSLWDELLSGTLEARIVLRAYSALIHRFPTAYCSLTGWKVESNL